MVELFWIKSYKQKKPADLTISGLTHSRQRPTFPQPYGGSIISTKDEFIIGCFLETEIGKAGVIIRTPAQWPAVFAI